VAAEAPPEIANAVTTVATTTPAVSQDGLLLKRIMKIPTLDDIRQPCVGGSAL
jgi:hypothetical protein